MSCASARLALRPGSPDRTHGPAPRRSSSLLLRLGMVVAFACALAFSCGTELEPDFSVPSGSFEWVGPFPHEEESTPGSPNLVTQPLRDLPVDGLIVEDANDDGIDDLLWCRDSVGLLLGAEEGSFVPYEIPANPDVGVGDFGTGCSVAVWKDKNGKQSNVAAAFGNGLSLSFPMDGDMPAAPLVLPPLPGEVEGSWQAMGPAFVADVDGDGQGEMLRLGVGMPDAEDSPVAVLVSTSQGNGAFLSKHAWELPLTKADLPAIPEESFPALLFAGDLDGEEGVDLAAEGTLVIFNADTAPSVLGLELVKAAPTLFADVDGDERTEIVSAQGDTCTVISLNGGEEKELGTFACPGGEQPGCLLAADIDHDGKDEIASADEKLVTVYRLEEGGNATVVGATQTNSSMMLSGALNWDGKGWDELLVVGVNAISFCTLSTDAGEPGTCVPHSTLPGYVIAARAPDIDRDGKADFLGICHDDVNLPPVVQALLAKDSFQTGPLSDMLYPHPNLGSPEQLVLQLSDLTADSPLDLLVGSTLTSQGPEFLVPMLQGHLPAFSRMQRNDALVSPQSSPDSWVSLVDYDGDGIPEAGFPDGAWTKLPAPGEPPVGAAVPAPSCPSGRLTVAGPIVADSKDLIAVADGHVVRLMMYSNIAGNCQDLAEGDVGDEIRDMLLAPDGRIAVLGARSSGGSSGQGVVTGRIHVITFDLVEEGGEGKITRKVHELFSLNCNPDQFEPLGMSSKPEHGYVVSCRDGGDSGHLLKVPPAPAMPSALALPPLVSPGAMASGDLDADGVKDIVVSHAKGVLMVSIPQGE